MANKNWFLNPTKKQMTVFVSIGIFGSIGLALSMTNFLTESPFQGKYWIFLFLFVNTFITTWQLIKNYNRSTKQ